MELDFKSVYMAIRTQWKSINAKIKEKLEEVGLTSQYVSYLVTLATNENIKIKELNSLVGNDPALTTRVLNKLFLKEFVAKTEENTRKCKLYLTKKGKELMASLEKIFNAYKLKITKDDFAAFNNITKSIENI